jgi:hypothetical protein
MPLEYLFKFSPFVSNQLLCKVCKTEIYGSNGQRDWSSHASNMYHILVPHKTELLFDLGLTDEIVGIKFCIHPKRQI